MHRGVQRNMGQINRAEIQIVLPWPPSTNEIWRSGNKRTFKSKTYRAWLEAAGVHLAAQRPKPIEGPVDVCIRLRRGTKHRFDIDNHCKAILDLLVTHGLIQADHCFIIHSLFVAPDHSEGEPMAFVTINEAISR